jgi:AraC family transcriptional activator of pobA
MPKAKNTLPVYDICSLSGAAHLQDEVMAERFADYLKVHPNLHHAHGHSFYHLVLFTRGGGYHTIDFNRFPVKAGELYFMVPGQVHSWSFEGDVDGFVVNFSDALFQSFLKDDQYLDRFHFFSGDTSDQVIMLAPPELEKAIAIMEQLTEEAKDKNVLHLDAVRLQLLLLFILVARSSAPGSSDLEKPQPGQLVLQSFRKLLNQYYHQYKLPKDYAAMLYVTPNYLNALCNDLLGKSAGELIRERILLEAKRQLVNHQEGIAGIGYNLGFTDNSYFTKFFKKYTGTTPEDFRREIQSPPIKN